MKVKDILEKKIILNKEMAAAREIEGQVIFLHKKERKLYELNKTAGFIWEKANGKISIEKIINRLLERYKEANKDKIEEDAVFFINLAVKKEVFVLVQ